MLCKTEGCHGVNFVVTFGCNGSCHHDKLLYKKLQQPSCINDPYQRFRCWLVLKTKESNFSLRNLSLSLSLSIYIYIYIRPVFILDWWKNKIPSSLEYRKTYICTSTFVVMRMDFINIDRTQEYEIAPFLATRGTLPMFDSETEILQFRNVYDSMNSVVGATSPCCEIEQNTAFCAGQLNQWNLGLIFLQIQYRLTH